MAAATVSQNPTLNHKKAKTICTTMTTTQTDTATRNLIWSSSISGTDFLLTPSGILRIGFRLRTFRELFFSKSSFYFIFSCSDVDDGGHFSPRSLSSSNFVGPRLLSCCCCCFDGGRSWPAIGLELSLGLEGVVRLSENCERELLGRLSCRPTAPQKIGFAT